MSAFFSPTQEQIEKTKEFYEILHNCIEGDIFYISKENEVTGKSDMVVVVTDKLHEIVYTTDIQVISGEACRNDEGRRGWSRTHAESGGFIIHDLKKISKEDSPEFFI